MDCPQNIVVNRPVGRSKQKQTHCMKGHEFTEDNTIIRGNGTRLCRACRNTTQRNRYLLEKELPDDAKFALWLKTEYHISVEKYDSLLAQHNYTCPICTKTFLKKGFVVDHDHSCCPGIRSCGKCVRGIVCRGCNVKLGAIDYYFTNRDRIDRYYILYNER